MHTPVAFEPVTPSPRSPVFHLLARSLAWLVRKRILVSIVVVSVLVAEDMALGFRPHDLVQLDNPWTLCGLIFVFAGLGFRSWAAGVLRKNRALAVEGPYSLTRNPLYLGTLFMMIGFSLLLDDYENHLVMLALFLILYFPQIHKEERAMTQYFGREWSDYASRTPRLVPRSTRAVRPLACWSFGNWRSNREYKALAATILALTAIKVWHDF